MQTCKVLRCLNYIRRTTEHPLNILKNREKTLQESDKKLLRKYVTKLGLLHGKWILL